MTLNRNIVITSIVAYFLLTVYAVYFKFFPVIFSPIISNIFLLGVLAILLGILVIQPFLVKMKSELYCVLPQYLIFAFVTRAIPTLRLTYQPLEDPYYYFISTLNVANFGTLEPFLSWWYGLTQQQLSWPDLHIIGSSLMTFTGIQSIEILRYVLPGMGAVFFLGVFLLAKEITNNVSVALLAGLFASTSDSVLFYQSEYHPQGIAFIYFVFFLVLIIRYFSTPSLVNGSLMIVYALVFSLSHHFSSVFFGMLSVFFLLSFWIFQSFFSRYINFNDSKQYNYYILPWTIIAILMFFSHIFKYPAFLKVVSSAMMNEIVPIRALITYGPTVPLQATILNSLKYLLLGLAIISILYIFKSKNKKEFFCFIILIGILIAGAIGTFIAFIPVDRLIGFYVPFAALFASLTLYRFHDVWLSKWRTKYKKIIIVVISLMILIAGPLNFFGPALIFHDSPKDPYYWHCNDYSGFSSYGVPGDWIKKYISQQSTFSSYNDTFMIPYFYGQIPATRGYSDGKSSVETGYYIFPLNIIEDQNPSISQLRIYAINILYNSDNYEVAIKSNQFNR